MKQKLPVVRPPMWARRMLFFLVMMIGGWSWGWGANPSMAITPNSNSGYCRNGDTLTVTINVGNSNLFWSFNNLTANGTPLPRVSGTGNVWRFVLNSSVSCGNNVLISATFDWFDNQGGFHNNDVLTKQIDIDCPLVVTFPNSSYCSNSGNVVSPTISGFDNPGPLFSVQGNAFSIANGTGEIVPNGQNGTYTIFWAGQSPNCPTTSGSTTVTFSSTTVAATISYSPTKYCKYTPTTTSPPNLNISGGSFSIYPNTNISIDSQGRITTTASTPPGTYVITYTPPIAACSGPVSTSIEVQDDAPSIAFPTATYCTGNNAGLTPMPQIISMPSYSFNGTYSTTPPLPCGVLNCATGQIDLSTISIPQGTAQNFQFHYQTPSSNQCNLQYNATGTITIGSAPNPSFSYNPSLLCKDATSANPILLYPAMQQSFYAPGISINGQGVINPSLTTATGGPFPVFRTVTTPGTSCAATAQTNISIYERDQSTFYYGTNPSATWIQFCPGDSADIYPHLMPGSAQNGTYSGGGAYFNAAGDLTTYPTASQPVTTITYTTNGNCPSTSTFGVELRVPPNPFFQYAEDSICRDMAVSQPLLPASPPVGGGTFSSPQVSVNINTGQINPTASLGVGGPFPVTYEFQLPQYCPASHTEMVSLIPPDIATFYYGDTANVPSHHFCSNDNFCDPHYPAETETGGTFQFVSCSSGTNSGSPTINAANGHIEFNNGSGKFCVQYTTIPDPPCGPKTATFTIYIDPSPSPFFNFLPDYCPMGIVDPDTMAPSSQSSFACLNPGLIFADTSLGKIDTDSSLPGTYLITHTVGVGTRCASSFDDVVKINSVNDSTHLQISDSIFCAGDTITVSVIQEDPSATFFRWNSVPSGLTASIQNSSQFAFTYLGQTNTTFTIGYYDYGDCDEFSEVTVEAQVRDATPLDYELRHYHEGEYCKNDSMLLPPDTLSGAGLFVSTPPGLAIDSITGVVDLPASTSGTYIINFHPDDFCKQDGEYIMTVRDAPNRDFLGIEISPDTICTGQAVGILVPQIDTLQYLLNSDTIAEWNEAFNILNGVNDGDTLDVHFINEYGCREDFSHIFTVHPYPIVTLTPSDSTVYVDADSIIVSLQSTAPNTQFTWYTSLTGSTLSGDSLGIDSVALPNASISYFFEPIITPGTSIMELAFYLSSQAYGCHAPDDSVRFIIIPNSSPPIFIPGVFTPNGDGLNDTWIIEWPGDDPVDYEDYKIQVFNRSGGLVYDMPRLHPNWTGDNLPEGVYRYILRDPQGNFVRHGGLSIQRSKQ